MKQMTLAAGGFDRYAETTRRAAFLAEMNRVVPWQAMCALIEPYYPKAGNGCPPVGLERMLRIYFLQNRFNLSDPAVEEALYDSVSMREFVGIDLGREAAPDETTMLKFRHLLERHELGKRVFEKVGRHLQACGWTAKRLIHSVVATPANVHDKHPLPQLLHGNERRVYGDSAYSSQKALIAEAAPKARDFTHRKGCRNQALTKRKRGKNRRKSSVRARVEHAFLVIKRIFGFAKTRYRGIMKNGNRRFVVAGLANLFMV